LLLFDSYFILFELLKQGVLSFLFKVLEVVGRSAFRLRGPVNNIAGYMPFLSLGYSDFNTLSDERSSWLVITNAFLGLG
jgi:hypothetical protein